jgi:hypothetical protein
MKRCSVCGGKFGLTRHYYDLKSFCSAKCLASYKGRWERLREHLRSLSIPLKDSTCCSTSTSPRSTLGRGLT